MKGGGVELEVEMLAAHSSPLASFFSTDSAVITRKMVVHTESPPRRCVHRGKATAWMDLVLACTRGRNRQVVPSNLRAPVSHDGRLMRDSRRPGVVDGRLLSGKQMMRRKSKSLFERFGDPNATVLGTLKNATLSVRFSLFSRCTHSGAQCISTVGVRRRMMV